MYAVAWQIETGFQSNKYKETRDFTKAFMFVHEMIKFQESTFWQPLKVVWNYSVPAGELLVKGIATHVNSQGIKTIPITYGVSESSDVRTKEVCNLPLTRWF